VLYLQIYLHMSGSPTDDECLSASEEWCDSDDDLDESSISGDSYGSIAADSDDGEVDKVNEASALAEFYNLRETLARGSRYGKLPPDSDDDQDIDGDCDGDSEDECAGDSDDACDGHSDDECDEDIGPGDGDLSVDAEVANVGNGENMLLSQAVTVVNFCQVTSTVKVGEKDAHAAVAGAGEHASDSKYCSSSGAADALQLCHIGDDGCNIEPASKINKKKQRPSKKRALQNRLKRLMKVGGKQTQHALLPVLAKQLVDGAPSGV
jgi:hypothetical protein